MGRSTGSVRVETSLCSQKTESSRCCHHCTRSTAGIRDLVLRLKGSCRPCLSHSLRHLLRRVAPLSASGEGGVGSATPRSLSTQCSAWMPLLASGQSDKARLWCMAQSDEWNDNSKAPSSTLSDATDFQLSRHRSLLLRERPCWRHLRSGGEGQGTGRSVSCFADPLHASLSLSRRERSLVRRSAAARRRPPRREPHDHGVGTTGRSAPVRRGWQAAAARGALRRTRHGAVFGFLRRWCQRIDAPSGWLLALPAACQCARACRLAALSASSPILI